MHERICVISKRGTELQAKGFIKRYVNDISEISDVVTSLPDDIKYIVYTDRNIVLANKMWQQEMEDLLERCYACQLFETVYVTDNYGRIRNENHSGAYIYVNNKSGNILDYEIGTAWGFKRELAENGIVDDIFLARLFFKVETNVTPDERTRQWLFTNRGLKGKSGCVRGAVIIQENEYTPPSPPTIVKASNKRVKCDVVIPYCVNNVRWLKESIDSICNQYECDPIVHVVADGFKTPNSVLEEYEYSYKKLADVRLYESLERIGPYRITNKLYNYFETDYIAIQDSDDISLPHRINYSINYMNSSNTEMFGGAMRQFASFDTKDGVSEEYVRTQPIHSSSLTDCWSISPHGIVINGTRVMTKELFWRMNGFAPLFMSADCEFTTRCIKYGEKVSTDNEIVALRRVHGKSLSRGSEFGLQSKIRQSLHDDIFDTYKKMPEEKATYFGGINKETCVVRRIT